MEVLPPGLGNGDVEDERKEAVRNGSQVSNLAIGWCHSSNLEIDSSKLAEEGHS